MEYLRDAYKKVFGKHKGLFGFTILANHVTFFVTHTV